MFEILYSQKIWRGIKFGGLAVLGENRQIKIRQNLHCVHVCILFQTAKFKSANTPFGGKPPNLITTNISGYTVATFRGPYLQNYLTQSNLKQVIFTPCVMTCIFACQFSILWYAGMHMHVSYINCMKNDVWKLLLDIGHTTYSSIDPLATDSITIKHGCLYFLGSTITCSVQCFFTIEYTLQLLTLDHKYSSSLLMIYLAHTF